MMLANLVREMDNAIQDVGVITNLGTIPLVWHDIRSKIMMHGYMVNRCSCGAMPKPHCVMAPISDTEKTALAVAIRCNSCGASSPRTGNWSLAMHISAWNKGKRDGRAG